MPEALSLPPPPQSWIIVNQNMANFAANRPSAIPNPSLPQAYCNKPLVGGGAYNVISNRYDGYFANAAAVNGVDPNVLKALAATESTPQLSPTILGRNEEGQVRGVGVMQINPVAHPEYTMAQLLDPKTNIEAGAKIYKGYLDKTGNEETAILAYKNIHTSTTAEAQKILTDYQNFKTELQTTAI